MRNFGWNASKLAECYSIAELNVLRSLIESEPGARNPPGSFFIFTKKTRRKLDAIAWAMTHKAREHKLATADPSS